VSNSTAVEATSVTAELLSLAQSYLTHPENDGTAAEDLEAAWNEFYQLCTRTIRKFAFRCGTTENDIADCLQDVWTELIARLPSFHLDPNRGQFETWLFRIVRSKSVNLRRSNRRGLLQETADALQIVADDRADSAHRSEAEEVVSQVWDLLRERLSECNLQILRLRLVEGLPGAEVAERLGLTHEQVRYRYHRARRELEEIGAAWSRGQRSLRPTDDQVCEGIEKMPGGAQQKFDASVPRGVNSSSPTYQGVCCVDYVFQRLELGRRELTPEWKVDWDCGSSPKPVLYLRKTAVVAYAEICGCEEFVVAHWPRVVNAAIAAGVAAGIATIIATPSAALPVFRAEFCKQLYGKAGGVGDENIYIALSAKQEANGPWSECKD
jgi:RNA polymerase sigma-70 factor (ECF subfamily)